MDWTKFGSADWWLGDNSFFGQAMETMSKYNMSFFGFGRTPMTSGFTQDHWTLILGIGAFYLLAKK